MTTRDPRTGPAGSAGADNAGAPPSSTPPSQGQGQGQGPGQGADRRVGPRSALIVPLRCRFDSVLDFVEAQSVNVSVSGMFIATDAPPPVGSRVSFQFALTDGFTLLEGAGEVVRVVTTGPVKGMGIRFVELDEKNSKLIERIVAVNASEGRSSRLGFDFSRPATAPSLPVMREPPVTFDGRTMRIVLDAETAPFFVQSPLLNVKMGGFFVPVEEDAALGATFPVAIVEPGGKALVAGKGKVVAKQEKRLGVRVTDLDKDALARLQGAVAKLAASK